MNATSNNISYVEKNVFPIYLNDCILYGLFIFLGILSSLVGIGGGGLYIPLFMLLSNFSLKEIIPLVVISILANSFIRMLILLKKKHIYNDQYSLIDYFIASQIMCFDASGSYIGYYLNTIINDNILKWIIFFLLIVVSLKTLIKSYKMCKIYYKNKNLNNEIIIDGISVSIPKNDEINLNEKVKKVSIFYTKILILTYQFIFNIFFILRYFFNNNLIIIICQSLYSFLSGIYVTYLNYKHNPSINLNMQLHSLFLISFASFSIGILSTMLGIGGGMLVAPLLIFLKIDSNIVMATNSMTTFFSALTSSMQYIIVGNIKYDFMLLFILLSIISSKTGLSYVKTINKKCSSTWPLILLLGLVIFISSILIIISK